MLIITRKRGESVFIRLPNERWIQVKFVEMDGEYRCVLGFQAPDDCTIIREELRSEWRDRKPKAKDKEGHREADSPQARTREEDLPQIPGNSRGRTGSSLGPNQRTYPPIGGGQRGDFRRW